MAKSSTTSIFLLLVITVMMSLPVHCRISAVGTSSVYAAVLTLRKRKGQATPDYIRAGFNQYQSNLSLDSILGHHFQQDHIKRGCMCS